MQKAGALLLALALLLSWAPAAFAAETASTMQLTKTEGTVTVANASGRGLSVREKMRLYSGYVIKTGLASYAWVALDSTKLVKLDANSEVEIHKNGKSLELLVQSGSLFFNVTEPLKEDETLNICTSTMVAGVRGTIGYANVVRPSRHTVTKTDSSISLLEGRVVCKPVSKGSKTAITIKGGESLNIPLSVSSKDLLTDLAVKPLTPQDIPGFVLVDVAQDAGLISRITQAGMGDLVNITPEQAREKQEEDEQNAQREADAVKDKMAASPGQIQPAPGSGSESSSSDSSGGSGNSGNSGSDNSGGGETGQPEDTNKTGDFTVTGGTYGTDYEYSNSHLFILSDKPLTIRNKVEGATTDRIMVDPDAPSVDVTLAGVNITGTGSNARGAAFSIPMEYTGTVTVRLAEGSTNILQGSSGSSGLQKDEKDAKLIITGTGTLIADAGSNTVGIGGSIGGEKEDRITITGGTVIATGDLGQAGIGSMQTVCVTIDGDTFVHIKTPHPSNDPKLIKGTVFYNYRGNSGIYLKGTTKGDVTLHDNVTVPEHAEWTIPSGASLTIPEGKTLTIPSSAELVIESGATLNKYGSIIGNYRVIPSEPTDTGDFTVGLGNSGEYNGEYSYSDGVLTIEKAATLTISGTSTKDRIEVSSKAGDVNITLNGVNINTSSRSEAAFLIQEGYSGNVTVNLAQNSKNELKSGSGCAGLQKGATGTLTITGTGMLTATGGDENVGIGGSINENGDCGIMITGGTIIASCGETTDSDGLAGIGDDRGTYVTINGDAFVHIKTQYANPLYTDTGLKLTKGTVFYNFNENSGTEIRGMTNGEVTLHDDVTIPDKGVWTISSGATFTIPQGKTLTIPVGAKLTIESGGTLTNNGLIQLDGKIQCNGGISGCGGDNVKGSGEIRDQTTQLYPLTPAMLSLRPDMTQAPMAPAAPDMTTEPVAPVEPAPPTEPELPAEPETSTEPDAPNSPEVSEAPGSEQGPEEAENPDNTQSPDTEPSKDPDTQDGSEPAKDDTTAEDSNATTPPEGLIPPDPVIPDPAPAEDNKESDPSESGGQEDGADGGQESGEPEDDTDQEEEET